VETADATVHASIVSLINCQNLLKHNPTSTKCTCYRCNAFKI